MVVSSEGPWPSQSLHRLPDLQGIAHRIAQRRIHVGNQRHSAPSHRFTDLHHGLRQAHRVLQRLHERTAAHLYIQHDAVCSGSDLLGHDARCNQRNALHSGGHVPQRIELLVCRRQVSALAHHTGAYGIDGADKFLWRKLHTEAGNGFQLIHSAAGVSQTTPGHLRHRHSAGCHNGSHHHGGLVPHAAGGMLIRLEALNPRKIHQISRMGHPVGEDSGFMGIKPLK